MTRTRLRGKVGVWGHFHGGNIGDDVVVATLLAHIRQRLPGHELHAFSLKPSDTAHRHRVSASALNGGPIFPPPARSSADAIRRAAPPATEAPARSPIESTRKSAAVRFIKGLPGAGWARRLAKKLVGGLRILKRIIGDFRASPAIWRQLRSFDAVFVAGSGPVFDDMGGPWAHPYNLLRWTVLSRLAGTKFCLLNVGAGPICRPLSRAFLRWSIQLAHYHSFRDESSVQIAMDLGARKAPHLFCDMAFALQQTEIEMARAGATSGERPTVGVAPMAYMDRQYWHNADTSIADRYVEALADLSLWLMAQGYDLVLLKSQRFADERTAARLLEKMRQTSPSLNEDRIDDPVTLGHEDLLQQMARCAFVIGGRFHCHVLPFALGIPVLGVSYHPKTDELMKQMRQEEYFLRMESVTGDALINMFTNLNANRAEVSSAVSGYAAKQRALLEQQFDEIFSEDFLIGATTSSVEDPKHG